LGHSIVSEAATEIPLHEIAFSVWDLDNVELPEYDAPMPVLVRRADGGVITVGDVVQQLSHYFTELKDKILEAKSPFLQMTHEVTATGEHIVGIPAYEDLLAPPDTQVAFEEFFGGIHNGRFAVPVELWADGEEGKSLEYFWKTRVEPDIYSL
jgi:hypothetical protein